MTFEQRTYVLGAIAAAAAGVLVVEASPIVVIVAAACLLGVGAIRLTGFRLTFASPFAEMPTADAVDDGRFRTARSLAYGGLATSCCLRLRVHGVTVSDGLFLVALACAALDDLARHESRYAVLPRFVWPGILLFVAGGTISTIANSSDQASSFGVILRVFFLVAAWFWLGAVAFRTRQQVWTALKWWVASAAVCGMWALGQKYGHLPGSVDYGRYAGLADHVNDLGDLEACAFVPALALAYRDRRWLLAVIGTAAGLALSGSIGATAGALIALAVGLTAKELVRPTATALVVGGLALIVIGPALGSSAISRISTSTNSSALYGRDTFVSRLSTYSAAWHRIESSPLLGTGLDVKSSTVYSPTSGQSFQVHNLFLGRLYDSGILGFIGVLLIVGGLGQAAWRLVLSSPDRYLALALLAGFLAYVVDDLSEPSLYKRYSLVPALLVVALRAVAWRQAPRQRSLTPAVAFRGSAPASAEPPGGGAAAPTPIPSSGPSGTVRTSNQGVSGEGVTSSSAWGEAMDPARRRPGRRKAKGTGGPKPIHSGRVSSEVKLNVGCGKTVPEGWVNIDKSPSVALSSFPRVRRALGAVGALSSQQAEGFPPGVVHANVAKRIPADDNSVGYVYSAHMIEHLSRWEGLAFLKECRRVLVSGGVLRLATPDLALMVRDYLEGTSPMNDQVATPADAFCLEYGAYANSQGNPVQAMIHKTLSGAVHQWLYDFTSIEALLKEGGFSHVARCEYRQGNVPDLAAVEHRERSLFVEAT